MKKTITLLLTLCLLLGLLPAAAFGAEPSDEPVQTKYVYEETDGVCRAVREEDALPEKPILITFDDGYRSNYDLVYPILREYGVKACISIIVLMPDLPTDNFCTWEQLREMTDSGLVEVGSHSYRLHNLGEDKGNYEKDGTNGVERRPGESDGDFQARVLDDIQKSHDRIAAELGSVTCFAYPFGCTDPDAKALVDALFPVSLMTVPQCADLAKGLHDLPRYAVHMETNLADLLN